MTERAPEGRPSSFDISFVRQAEKLCVLGATDAEIADFFGVTVRTIYRWKAAHDEFCQALKAGKELADNRVERSLYQKATGFTYVEQQAFKVKKVEYLNGKRLSETEELKVVDVERFSPPDTTAMIFWLKNRRPEQWRDKTEHVIRHELAQMSDDELTRVASGSSKGASAPKVNSPQLN